MKRSEEISALIISAFKLEYTDEARFIDVVAKEFTISNSGQTVEAYTNMARIPADRVIDCAFQAFKNEAESDEHYDGLMEEFHYWKKDAPKMIAKIKAKGLPLTVQNAIDAWTNKREFA